MLHLCSALSCGCTLRILHVEASGAVRHGHSRALCITARQDFRAWRALHALQTWLRAPAAPMSSNLRSAAPCASRQVMVSELEDHWTRCIPGCAARLHCFRLGAARLASRAKQRHLTGSSSLQACTPAPRAPVEQRSTRRPIHSVLRPGALQAPAEARSLIQGRHRAFALVPLVRPVHPLYHPSHHHRRQH
jgi:hypothetical protein